MSKITTQDVDADLKSQFENYFIPAIIRMISKEQEHLSKLKEIRRKHKLPVIHEMIANSMAYLAHYELRLIEYKNFFKDGTN